MISVRKTSMSGYLLAKDQKKKKKNTDTLKNTMEWNSTSDLL